MHISMQWCTICCPKNPSLIRIVKTFFYYPNFEHRLTNYENKTHNFFLIRTMTYLVRGGTNLQNNMSLVREVNFYIHHNWKNCTINNKEEEDVNIVKTWNFNNRERERDPFLLSSSCRPWSCHDRSLVPFLELELAS